MRVSGATRVFALLGDPVAHSLSPVMHNAAFHALGLNAIYVALRCEAAALGALMESLARQGGGGNVTVPHKHAAAQVLAASGSLSNGDGICNTFWSAEGKLTGAETDSTAILAALAQLGGVGTAWLLLGTGGSAHAALLAARRVGVRVAARSRAPERAEELLDRARALGVQSADPEAADVVLNCTPLGLRDGDPVPLEPARIPAHAIALDLVYRPGLTAWVRALRSCGHAAADGRTVLLEQGAAAFEHWFPGQRAPREVMRAALQAALE